MDRLTETLFKSVGRKAVERMARGVSPLPGADPEQVEAALQLAKLARQYLQEKFHLVIIQSEGQILDEVRMEQFLQDHRNTQPRVNPPMLEDLRPTTRVRDSIGRSRKLDKGQQAERRAEAQGKVPFYHEGRRHMVEPWLLEMLKKAMPQDG